MNAKEKRPLNQRSQFEEIENAAARLIAPPGDPDARTLEEREQYTRNHQLVVDESIASIKLKNDRAKLELDQQRITGLVVFWIVLAWLLMVVVIYF